MRTRTTAVTAVTAALVAVLAACGSAPNQTPGAAAKPAAADIAGQIDETAVVDAAPVGQNLPSTPMLDKIRQKGELTFAGSRNTIGFSQLDPATGKLSGFDAGIAQLLAKYLLGKPDAKLQSGGSDTREALLGNHTIDVAIQTYTITPDRAKLVNFAGPYYMAASGIVVKSADTTIKQASDLAGKNVATESGAAKDALLAAVPTAKPILFDTAAQCVAAVEQGRAEAMTLNNASLYGVIATKSDVKLLDATFGTNPFGIGMPKDDPKFKDVVNQFLTTIEADGTWTKLWQSTVGKLIKTPAPQPPQIGSVPGS
ncbi:transporter substrate-binding domain-containing protein [Amycolatopsis sp. WQ 127309]|uniref:transporter substrate-binding domain-containing protein n=1 Tax=Amycolatopsis sp. WQ 127309 TaxID=2932773 RepID=UPI001FF32697|nr:transporter substrate-binding domain-containing protein [Amycolatopsis sp. WQ 127309]UOZ02949.1 transporter substrate-binding domain-containing protein [Amycolatopsis sp. WQ 127309]